MFEEIEIGPEQVFLPSPSKVGRDSLVDAAATRPPVVPQTQTQTS